MPWKKALLTSDSWNVIVFEQISNPFWIVISKVKEKYVFKTFKGERDRYELGRDRLCGKT